MRALPGLAALLVVALAAGAAAAADAPPAAQPCLTVASVRFGPGTYVRRYTESGDGGYVAGYYPGAERPNSWSSRIELRSYPRAAGRTPVEVAAGIIALERAGNPVLRASPVALNAERTLVLLDYTTWSEATLHAGYVEVDVFKFFVARDEPHQVLGFRFAHKLPIAQRSRDALVDDIRRVRGAAVQSMLQLPLCEWAATAPATTAWRAPQARTASRPSSSS